jgi:alkylation response protein AidB-like acyl-CoA dehydrogenase
VDFSLSDEQEAVVSAAAKLFEGQLTDTRWAELSGGDRFDRKLWAALAEANLLGLAVGEEYGGSGLGFGELSVLLEEAGRAAAPVPLWPGLVLGGLTVDKWGTGEQKARLLNPLVSGDLVLTAALVEPGTEPEHPLTTARAERDGSWRIDGSKTCVPAGSVAGAFLVTAGSGMFIVEAGTPGLDVTPLTTTSGSPEARLDLNGVVVGPDAVLGEPDGASRILDWLLPRATSGLCSLMAGTCQASLRLTADYAIGRQQFDRAIASFQAVGQRAADAYVDTEAVSITARQAAWRLSEDLPADEQVAIAKFWAAEGGQRVVHAAQHIHGGMGVDRSYPLHRYFLAAKEIELTLGGATANLRRLGALMAGSV